MVELNRLTMHLFAFFCFTLVASVYSANNTGCELSAMCPKREIIVNWWGLAPYITETKDPKTNKTKITGLLKDVMELLVKDCCGECVTFKYLEAVNNSLDLQIGQKNSAISLPVYGNRDMKTFKHHAYLPVLESPGILYLTKLPEDGEVANSVISTAVRGGTVLLIGMLMAMIAGILMWMLDSYINYDEFPKTFFQGIWKGFWWSIVTMTTVGYGDKVPKTILARSLAICWAFIGTIIFALFSSSITSYLTARSLSPDVTVIGKQVIVLNGSQEKNFGVRSNAKVTSVNSLYEFAQKLSDTKTYKGGLIDSYVAGASEVLSDENNGFYIRKIFDYQFMYGFVLSNEFSSTELSRCLVKGITLQEYSINALVSKKLHALPELNEDKYKSLTTSVFSATSVVFQQTAIRCAIIIIVFLVCGFIWQKCLRRGPGRNKIGEQFVSEDDVFVEVLPGDMVKRQLQEYEDLLVREVLLYIKAFQKRQHDLRVLITNPILHKQLPEIINEEDIHFAKYSGTY